ncbi:hypothetical protein E6C27_scaffold679G00070 [Cucumis melo var. makuwa]|uniref:Uncharacterized protein n=1 Tax=Cucumis melo var. makuwa TaxID=1194695 RepID=A0A5A7V4L9_CUCMM|nr:hypothetical protein E6C27_scaffold679G00070 [Cucumis melo var. makuwa]
MCASFGSTRLICAFYGTTRLLCRVRAQRGADRREARRTREGHMDASGFLIASAINGWARAAEGGGGLGRWLAQLARKDWLRRPGGRRTTEETSNKEQTDDATRDERLPACETESDEKRGQRGGQSKATARV